MSKQAADGRKVHRGWSGLRSALALAVPALIAISCGSAHEKEEDVGEVSQALTGTGGSKATGGAKATGGKSSTGGTKSTGGTSATGGSKATGGKSSTGGSKTTGGTSSTGGSKATGGKSSTGGSKATGGKSSTGGSLATGGKSSTGGSKATGGSSSPPPCSPVDCNDNNACTTDVCNSGTCSHTPVNNGTSCNDGNACTQTDTCQNGTCTGINPVVCTALDACHVAGTCNTSNGTCSNPVAPDGTSCTDNNACTTPDTCLGGVCQAGPPVMCTAQDACHTVGTCNPGTGTCSSPVAPDGTTCSDSNACTQTDACQSGTCVGGNPVSVDDGDPCTTDSCDPVLGVQHVPVTDNPNCAQWYSGGLKVEVKTNYCDPQKVQQYFQVTNTGNAPVNLSDISIRYWVYDTTGANVVSDIYYPGCVVTSPSNLTCEHPVTGVSTLGTSFPVCGADASHQANWEVTLTPTDSYALQLGHQWNNVQTVVHLDNWATFTPGTSQWYSTCLTNPNFATDPHFAVYYKGNLVFSSGINAPSCRGPQGTQQLSGYLTPDITNAPLVGPVPPTTPIHLSIRLPIRTPAPSEGYPDLPTFVKQVSDPNSPTYRRYLSPTDFAQHYGPLVDDYKNKLSSWALSENLTVDMTWPNRLLLNVSGTAAAVEQAFYVNLNYRLRPDGTQFYALDRDPSLNLATAVAYVGNLNNYYVPRFAGSGPGTYNNGANDLGTAYAPTGCSSVAPGGLTGTNQCVALIEFGPVDDNDLYLYAQLIHSPFQTSQVSRPPIPGLQPLNVSGSSLEATLDAEMVISMAPGADIVFYPATATYTDEQTVCQAMASDLYHNHCNQISISSEGLPCQGPYIDQIFPAQGQSVFYSSGDYGANEALSPLPSLDFLTLVGGTELTMTAGNAAWQKESAWDRSQGGIIAGLDLPDYQTGIKTSTNGASDNSRNYPDVSMPAWELTIIFDGVTQWSGGTSASAPLWAGFMALVNQQNTSNGFGPVGFFNPVLYAIGKSGGDVYGNSFHDVFDHSYSEDYHGVCCDDSAATTTVGYYADPGYDLATGWGTPQCGLISQLASPSPAPNWAVVAGHYHTCALRNNYSVSCWGLNDVGELGNGSTVNSSAPVPTGLSGVASLSAGADHTCAVMQNGGSVYCWGGNYNGQLGTGNTANSTVPMAVPGLSQVVSIGAGGYRTCAVLQSGQVECWGDGSSNGLGDGTNTSSSIPVQVLGITDAVSVSAGYGFSCAVLQSGNVQCWGDNLYGQLGDGGAQPSSLPVTVSGVTQVASVSAGDYHACAALKTDASGAGGGVYCWGDDHSGELGSGDTSVNPLTPVAVMLDASNTLSGVTWIAAGSAHSCAVTNDADHSLYCWGDNAYGQLGDGTTNLHDYATKVYGKNFAAVSAGFDHTCALYNIGNTGNTACWGADYDGQLGNRSLNDSWLPATVHFF